MTIRRCTHFTPSEIQKAWTSLSKRPQEVRVVTRGDRLQIWVGHHTNPSGLVGVFDMGIPLDDFADEIEHAAQDLYRN
jgi:hypothetical protein